MYCPRCKNSMSTPRVALSRVDNKTYICSPCGTDEAMFNFALPNFPLTPVTELVMSDNIKDAI